MKVRMKVEGGDALARKLQMIAQETANKHMRECALKGAEVIRAETEAKAPVGPSRVRVLKSGQRLQQGGLLKGDIVKDLRKQTKAKVDVYVGPSQKTGWYAAFVEDGHAIVVDGKKVGDVPPHPFLRPAFDATTDEAEDAFAKELKRRLRL